MKQTFTKFIIAESLILLIALTAACVMAFSYRNRPVDVVMLNDFVQTAREHMDDPQVLGDEFADADIMLLSADGSVLYRSDDDTFAGIASSVDAAGGDMLCMPVADGDRFLGTLILPYPAKADYRHLMRRILLITAFIMLMILASYLSFLWYINRNVIRPFRRLKEFAAKIAQGNLDEPLLLEQNNMFGLFTESFDLMREQLRAARSREIALKMKEKELVASLSHDLQSPVSGIRVICEVLEVKVRDAYVLGKIENIRRKIDEMNVLLSDLLSSALDDLGELNVNVAEISSQVLSRLAEEHDTKKKVSAEKVPDCILCIDPNRLSQVIGNIIGNSYKYADTKIEVTYAFADRYLKMTIRDHGQGAPAEELPLLTNKFYRGKKYAADKEGSGLGLYISSQLMKKMKGQLILSGDDGFAVTLFLPLA
ncbi:MAG: HAMP domain-containing histidine kinase [Lachnospiraceae bacterium]|nr:HAMP domain-containing histidine kinase [Lachnospiraceae bacterium]